MSLDWFKGKSIYRKPCFFPMNSWGFPATCALNQSNEHATAINEKSNVFPSKYVPPPGKLPKTSQRPQLQIRDPLVCAWSSPRVDHCCASSCSTDNYITEAAAVTFHLKHLSHLGRSLLNISKSESGKKTRDWNHKHQLWAVWRDTTPWKKSGATKLFIIQENIMHSSIPTLIYTHYQHVYLQWGNCHHQLIQLIP